MEKNYKKLILVIGILLLIAAGCAKVELKQETPASPQASYNQLPK